MNFNEYQTAAARTISCKAGIKQLYHGLFGLASEAGEVLGIYQKTYQGHAVERDHIVKELGDCLWMIAEICTSLDIQMDEVAQTNIEKLMKRYPNGFDPQRSLHRAKGDI